MAPDNEGSEVRLGNIEGTAAPKTTDKKNTETSSNSTRTREIAVSLAPATAIFLFQQVAFPVSSGVFLRGLIVGALTALVALGLALVHRVNHIINFAQADFGLLPAALVFLLMTESGLAWWVALVVGLVTAVGLGAGAERVVVRRFFRAPRLLATVATFGVGQVLAGTAIVLPGLWGAEIVGQPRMPAPVEWSATIGGAELTIYDVLALALAPAAIAAVVLLVRRSNLGSAIRACGDSKDRALLLGVPLFGLHNLVWGLTGALAFAAVFLRSGMLELPLLPPTLAFGVLLRALAAFWLGRLAGFTGIVSVSVALGALELGVAEHHHPLVMEPILLVIVLGALLLGRWRARLSGETEQGAVGGEEEANEANGNRANGDGESAWQTAFPRAFREVHAVPEGLARLPKVRVARWGLLACAGWVALSLPMMLNPDGRREVTTLLIYILVGLSLVVVSGWAGRLSAGQVGYLATGAAVGAWSVLRWDVDLVVAVALAALVGAAMAVIVGMPASKLPGHYVAVTTFALAVSAASLFNPQVFDWVPEGPVARTPLAAGWEVADGTFRVYYLVLVVVVAAMAGVYRLRRSSQLGRASVAFRDSEPVAQSCGIDGTAAQLLVHALSGALAAVAGALLVYSEQSYGVEPYLPLASIAVLSMMVIGGLTSVGGAVLGAVFLMGSRWLLPTDWEMLAIGVGMLLVLLFLPGGLASLLYDIRDRGLRALVREAPVDDPQAEAGVPQVKAPRVDLDVRPGEVIALVGPNRAGKSSLLRALSGLGPPHEGTVTFDGYRFDGLPADQVTAFGLVHVPSSHGVFPTLTVMENLRVASWPHRHDPATVTACMDRAVGLYPVLGARASERAGSLPTGDQQRLAMAMAVVSRPRLLMADELVLGPGPDSARELGRLARHLRDEGAALLFATASPKVARKLAKRTVQLKTTPPAEVAQTGRDTTR